MFKRNVCMEEAVGEELPASGGDAPADEGLLAAADTSDANNEPPPIEPLERPEYVKEQFWDADKGEVKIEALTKSQADFERQARTKHGDVPSDANDYEITIPEGVEIDLTDDPVIEASKAIALKHGMSKEAYDGFMGEMIAHLSENQTQTVDNEAEKSKLGDRADSIIEGVSKWADNLQEIGLLSEAEREALNPLGANADGVKALNKLRVHYTRGAPIPVNTVVEDGQMSKEEYYSAVGSDRYTSDVDYRNKVNQQAQRIFGTQPAGSSQPGLGVR